MHINKSLIQHTLINLGETINVMTRDTLLILKLQPFLRNNATILQLVDSSIVCPEEILEDNNVSIYSWQYLANFTVLKTKSKLSEYHIILG